MSILFGKRLYISVLGIGRTHRYTGDGYTTPSRIKNEHGGME